MNSRFVLAFMALFSALLNIPSARALQYTASLLHPVGYTSSVANDVAGSIQFGTGRGGDHPSLDHALLWQGTSASVVDLHPPGFTQSFGLGASDTMQVGYGQNSGESTNRALLWSGTPDSAIELHPTGYYTSVAIGVSGNQQVGYARAPTNQKASPYHALLWNGTAASSVDLHPAKFQSSQALDNSATSQVGRGCSSFSCEGNSHALLWHGTAASVVDLNPAGFSVSVAWAVAGEWQVGQGGSGFQTHALLWHGTAASVIDLNPPGALTYSTANDISIAGQVGSVKLQMGFPHATYWNGSAASEVDLHPFLSVLGITFRDSIATSISDDGIIAGYATDSSNNQYAVMWTPVPEPATCGLLTCGILATQLFLDHRRRRSRQV